MQKNDISKPQNLEMSFIFCTFAPSMEKTKTNPIVTHLATI